MAFTIDNLIIEITRRCNSNCAHCLRGPAQDIDITKETIEQLFVNNDIEYISCITFIGGEPTLNIQAINDFIDICEYRNIDVGSFYIVINGSLVPNELILTIARLYNFCSDNEISQIQVSESDFYYDQNQDEISKLEIFKIFSRKQTANNLHLIKEGNAIEWTNDYANGEGRTIDIDSENAALVEDPDEYNENRNISGDLYLNVEGNIIGCCDLSYISQDEHKLGNVKTDSLKNIIEKLDKKHNTGD